MGSASLSDSRSADSFPRLRRFARLRRDSLCLSGVGGNRRGSALRWPFHAGGGGGFRRCDSSSRRPDILARSLTILSLETSTPRGTAKIGKGPIVRVGDKAFELRRSGDGPSPQRRRRGGNSSATLPARRRNLRGHGLSALRLHLRRCEPRRSAIITTSRRKAEIAAEFVAIDDFVGMVRLVRGGGIQRTNAAGRSMTCENGWKRTPGTIARFIAAIKRHPSIPSYFLATDYTDFHRCSLA